MLKLLLAGALASTAHAGWAHDTLHAGVTVEKRALKYVELAKAVYCDTIQGKYLNATVGAFGAACAPCQAESMKGVFVEKVFARDAIKGQGPDTFGFAGWDADHIYFVWRGTEGLNLLLDPISGLTDVFVDIATWPVPYHRAADIPNYGRYHDVHAGFQYGYTSARGGPDGVIATFKALRLRFPTKQVVVTGHSLGGALATHCALDLALEDSTHKPWLYTFGSPRVGVSAWATFFNTKVPDHYRIVWMDDIVPEVPPRVDAFPLLGVWTSILAPYTHVGKLVNYHQHQIETCCTQSCILYWCSTSCDPCGDWWYRAEIETWVEGFFTIMEPGLLAPDHLTYMQNIGVKNANTRLVNPLTGYKTGQCPVGV